MNACPYCKGAGTLAAAEPPAPTKLTKTTTKLFYALHERLGQTATYEALAAAIWGDHQPDDPNTCIRSLVKRLRARMGDLAWRIDVNPGYGYTMTIRGGHG